MKKLKRISGIIILTVTLLIIVLLWLGLFNEMENRSLDFRFQLRGPQKAQSSILIAKIDDESLQTIGKWPWPRKIHARFADICKRAGASAVIYDVVFYEPDRYDPSNDREFERAIKRNGRVISAFDFKLAEEQEVSQDIEGKTQTEIVSTIIKENPIPGLVRASQRLGFANAWPDSDGYLRRGYLSFALEGTTSYALNIQAVSLFKNQSPEELLKQIPYKITQQWGYDTHEILINWRGTEDSFDSHSCAQILDSLIPEEWLKGKIIILGSTALGLYDHYPTPFSSSFPGLYYHANILDNLLTGEIITPKTGWLTIFLVIILGIICGITVIYTNVWISAIVCGLSIACFWGIGYLLLAKNLIYIELIAPTFSMASNYLTVFFYRFLAEQKEKAGIKKAFGVYVNPHVVEQIAKNPDALKLGGESREMSVMFSDVQGFTSISEKLSPEELVSLLNFYLTAMTDTIMKYDGTVDKYEGDAIMAFWGAPLIQPKHARQACLSVLENRRRLEELNRELEKKNIQKLFARSGINTGLMNVGNMGSTQKFNYTVMGDSVNLASRLEGANKQYGTYMMISESTYEQAKDSVEVRELDLLRVKGKNIPIKVFELVSKKGELSDQQKKGFDLFHQTLGLYRKQNFKQALKKFEQVMELLPDDPPSKTYIERTERFIEHPPHKDWDGVYVMTTK